jgi:hypothetical protein
MRAGTPSTGRLKKVSLGSAPLPPAVGRILDPLLVYDNLNLGRRIDPVWPEPEWRAKVTLQDGRHLLHVCTFPWAFSSLRSQRVGLVPFFFHYHLPSFSVICALLSGLYRFFYDNLFQLQLSAGGLDHICFLFFTHVLPMNLANWRRQDVYK